MKLMFNFFKSALIAVFFISIANAHANPMSYAYILDNESGNILQCGIGANGAFVSCNNNPMPFNYPATSMTINPAGNIAYITTANMLEIFACTIEKNGNIDNCNYSGIPGSNSLVASVIAGDNYFIYVNNKYKLGVNQLHVCTLSSTRNSCDDTTASTQIFTPNFYTLSKITSNPLGTYAYTITTGSFPLTTYISSCSIENNGNIDKCNSQITHNKYITGITIGRSGNFAYIPYYNYPYTSGGVTICKISTDGSLNACNDEVISNGAADIAFDPTGQYAYIADDSGVNVQQCTVSGVDGSIIANSCNKLLSGIYADQIYIK